MFGMQHSTVTFVFLSVIFVQLTLIYVFQNHVTTLRSCAMSSRVETQVIRDYKSVPGPDRDHASWNSSDETRRPNDTDVRPTEIFSENSKFHKEPISYTISYQRYIPGNYKDMLATDPEGNCVGISCKWLKTPGVTKELIVSAPELFQKLPLNYLENFKNPCWLRGETDLNCLPYFYIIGMYKTGTFEMWNKINSHPDVITSVPKEPHYWGMRRFGGTFIPCFGKEVKMARNLTGGKDDSSIEWYLNLYKALAVQDVINNNFTTEEGVDYHPKVFGEASVTTMNGLGRDWIKTYPSAASPPYTNADLLRVLQPNAKFILMIRNPTKRADSFFWYMANYSLPLPKGTDLSDLWHSTALEYISCFQKCVRNHNLRYCAYAAYCPYFDYIPNLQVSIYHVYIRDWLKVFTRDQFKVIRLEDWQADPVKEYRDVIKFLDLRPLTTNEEDTILGDGPANVNHHVHVKTKFETLKALNDFYRPYNQELAKLMGDERFNYPDYNG